MVAVISADNSRRSSYAIILESENFAKLLIKRILKLSVFSPSLSRIEVLQYGKKFEARAPKDLEEFEQSRVAPFMKGRFFTSPLRIAITPNICALLIRFVALDRRIIRRKIQPEKHTP